MVTAWLCISRGDHALSSWQGGGPLTADALDRLVDGTGIRTRPMRQAREWGYQRLAAAKAVVIIDAAPPPVAQIGRAHVCTPVSNAQLVCRLLREKKTNLQLKQ